MRLAASFAFTAGFYLWSAVLLILALPLLAGPRAGVIWLLQLWNSGLVVMLRGLCGVRVEIRGREHLPKGAALIAMKHQCMFDAMGLWHDLPGACYVLKKSLMLIPLFGLFAAKARMIVVDRQGHAKALRQMMSDAALRVKEGRQVIIFPEGTRKKPGAPADYKPGVAGLYHQELPLFRFRNGLFRPLEVLRAHRTHRPLLQQPPPVHRAHHRLLHRQLPASPSDS